MLLSIAIYLFEQRVSIAIYFIGKKIKMAQSMIDQFKNLNQRIRLLRSTGNISLQKINKLETYLNRRKQQNQYPLTHTQ